MSDKTLAVVLAELDAAYKARNHHRTEGMHNNLELMVAGLKINWLRKMIKDATGELPPKK